MASYQGLLDGLCGPYAIVNAFEHCGLGGDKMTEQIFIASCSALAKRRWPETIWEGTTFGDLQRMIKRCRETVKLADKIKVSYPFSRTTPRTNGEYWKKFDQLFEERPNIRCMILGMTRPSWHWIVAFRNQGETRVNFVDTDPFAPQQRKNRTMLHAGERSGHPNKWIIDRSELIIFEVE